MGHALLGLPSLLQSSVPTASTSSCQYATCTISVPLWLYLPPQKTCPAVSGSLGFMTEAWACGYGGGVNRPGVGWQTTFVHSRLHWAGHSFYSCCRPLLVSSIFQFCSGGWLCVSARTKSSAKDCFLSSCLSLRPREPEHPFAPWGRATQRLG